MKNEHLIPINLIDLVEKLHSSTNENERNNYVHRLEVIRDYCESALKKAPSKSMFEDLHKRKANTGKYSRIGRNNI